MKAHGANICALVTSLRARLSFVGVEDDKPVPLSDSALCNDRNRRLLKIVMDEQVHVRGFLVSFLCLLFASFFAYVTLVSL